VTTPEVLPQSSPDTGELLDGRYRLEAEVGRGGMGVVHRANDELLGRTVAVKVFRDSADDAARTTSETRLLAGLNHPSLVTLFDAKVTDHGSGYLVMEYVEGPTLRDRLASGPLSEATVAGMAAELAEALHVVHSAGVVHRDIKPSNVLLRPAHVPGVEFRAKLADFGIAYLIDSTRHTVPGGLVGTAAYLSPEQVLGADPVPASDVYALGLVLIEALTGERSFAQEGSAATALARLNNDPVVPGSLGYSWKSLLTAMTAREPSHRPSSLEIVVTAERLRTAALGRDVDAVAGPQTAALDTVPGVPADSHVTGSDGTAPTIVIGSVAPSAEPEAVSSPEPLPETGAPDGAGADGTPPVRVKAQASTKRWLIVAALVVTAVVIAAVVLVWLLSLSSAASVESPPALPAVEGELGGHLQQLLGAVTP
jgi:serine/threonine protein kinase